MSRRGTPSVFDRLVDRLSRLPGIGKRWAERLAFHLLKEPAEEALALADAIRELKENVQHCSQCFNIAESDPCSICADPNRNRGIILVVEQPNDVVILETTGTYNGVYHVLMGRIAPLDGVGPKELNISALLDRVRAAGVREVIVGTNPTLEGDGTALYLAEQLAGSAVKISQLARGLPTGSSLEIASKAVLTDAIEGRRPMGHGFGSDDCRSF